MDFVHLHNHSDFSLLDGGIKIGDYVERAKELGMKHLALTDHGNLFGAIHFSKACKSAGINPIIGCEVYVASGSRFDRSEKQRYHMVLLCKNETGYRNLMKLVSHSFTEGFYYKPRVDDELLEKYHEGLIATSACISGEIPKLLLKGEHKRAEERTFFYKNLFDNEFYLEIWDHNLEDEKRIRDDMIRLSQETKTQLIATNDIHYLKKEYAKVHDILLCIGTGKKQSDEKRMRMSSEEFYFKTAQQMAALFEDIPEAITNTLHIAEKCCLTIPEPGPILPEYKIPDEFSDQGDYLRSLTYEGLKRRYTNVTEEIEERANFELKTLIEMGYMGYFLIVWDFIHWAQTHNIPVGPGRGSGAGSIVAYALGITNVDPLKYGLLFERFLNPERISMPDFDIDFCFEGRNEVINYVTEKYGSEHVAGICTFGTLKSKAALKDVARVLDIPFDEANTITKLVQEGKTEDGRKITVKVAREIEPKLKEFYDRGGKYKELFDAAEVIEGMNRHVSTHACGKVISKDVLTNYVPLYKDQKTEEIISGYSMDIIEPCGLVKMDFLGLKTLTLLKNSEKLIKLKSPDFSLETIPEDDKKTFEMLGEGKSEAIFQFESSGMQDILRRAKPSSIEDLIALNSLYRPGPMQYIPQFIDSKNGTRKIVYPDPSLEKVLKSTYGVIVYQEQVMKVAQIIGGFSLGKADILRRAMGKKKEKEMIKMEGEFVEGAKARGYTEALAKKIFETLKPFAGYGFNKSHAAAYSIVAYQTAYCKANYPVEFMAANLTNEIDNPDSFKKYITAAHEMGIKIEPPDINISNRYFTVEDGKIFYGLMGIKGVGRAVVDQIIGERETAPFSSFEEFSERVDLRVCNKRALEVMVESGVFDSIAPNFNRSDLSYNLEPLIEWVSKKKEAFNYGQTSLFDQQDTTVFPPFEYKKAEEPLSKVDILKKEKEHLGHYFSGHPLDDYKEIWRDAVTLSLGKLERAVSNKKYITLGLVREYKEITTKSNKKMAFIQLEDYEGTIEMILFQQGYEKYGHLIANDKIFGFSGTIDTSRNERKFKIDDVLIPEQMEKKRVGELHVDVGKTTFDEETVVGFRSFLQNCEGDASLYIHMRREQQRFVIKASPYIKINTTDEIINEIKSFPGVVGVWKG